MIQEKARDHMWLVFAAAMLVVSGCGGGPATSSIDVGETGVLRYPDSENPEIPVYQTEAALEAAVKAANAKDSIGFAEALRQAYIVSAGTSVLVIDRSFNVRKVRILSGQYEGSAGYVPREWVARQ